MAKHTTVLYDSKATWDGKPYRSHDLYRRDQSMAMQAKAGTEVQVIAEHGDITWTDATMIRWEQIPGNDMGLIRFWVMINGREHMVDESRIRVP